LLARQRDGFLPRFAIWDDVRTFDGRPWNGAIDVISGGFPCQDISAAGRGAGIEGPQSGIWLEMARIICEVRPRYVFVENSPMLTVRGLGRVLGDLAAMGFDARWGVLGADDIGAPHVRKRVWIAANADGTGIDTSYSEAVPTARLSDTGGDRCCDTSPDTDDGRQRTIAINAQVARARDAASPANGQRPRRWWPINTIAGVADGMAHRMERIRATGNGQVPGVAALAWRILTR
jgi:DNA (cytosine-5)-methyltransferase 1